MSDGQIVRCDRAPEPTDGRIVHCDRAPEPSDGRIVICKELSCANPPELFLTGPDEPDVDDQYSASGGVPPYSYAFAGGSIDATGKITAVTSCGGPDGNGAVGSVSVTDACGQTAKIEVRLPGGFWSLQSPDGETCPDAAINNYTGWPIPGETTYTISGGTRTSMQMEAGFASQPYGECSSTHNGCSLIAKYHDGSYWRCGYSIRTTTWLWTC